MGETGTFLDNVGESSQRVSQRLCETDFNHMGPRIWFFDW